MQPVAQHSEPTHDIPSLTVEQLVSYLQESSQHDSSIYFEELMKRFEPLLKQAWRRCAFTTEYHDFVQQVYVQLFGNLPHLNNPKAFPGYFRKVVHSVSADFLRRQAPASIKAAKDTEQLVQDIDEQILMGIFVRSYLEHLTQREREVLTLEFFQEYSTAEIAKSLGISQPAVRVTKSRALARLRALILKEAKTLEENL